MRKLYVIGDSSKPRRRQIIQTIVSVTLVIGFIGAVIVFLDLNKDQIFTQSEPITSQVLSDQDPVKTVDMPTFTMEVPKTWEEKARTNNYIRFQGSQKDDTARYLEVFVDSMAMQGNESMYDEKGFNRLVPISTSPGGQIRFTEASAPCREYTEASQDIATPEPQSSKWKNIDFTCNFIEGWNKIGTGSEADGLLTIIKGEKTKSKYFFLYTDHNGRPNTDYFYDVLKTFRAK